MAFFDELGKKISQTSQGVVQKTKDTAETLKLNSAISDEEKRILNYCRDLGKAYYDTYGNNPDPAFAQIITSIQESENKIKQYKDQIIRLKGVAQCPSCGSEIANNAMFCSVCGHRMDTQSVTPSQEFCTSCGKPLTPGAMFCINCGAKVNTVPTQPTVEEAPAVPVQPVVEATPVVPEVPAQPVVEATPVVPEVPAQPVVEATPVVPEVPAQPVVEATPQQPTATVCSACNAVLTPDSLFCTNCGSAVATTSEMPVAKTCANCGAAVNDDSLFCTNCGTPVAR